MTTRCCLDHGGHDRHRPRARRSPGRHVRFESRPNAAHRGPRRRRARARRGRSRCTTSRPRWPIRCIGCTATCASSSRSRRASPSPTTPASTTRPASPSELAAELTDVRVVRLEQKGRGRALHAVWSTSDAPVLAYMDVDLSTDLAALAPLVAPLISGHSDLAIGTRLGRGARVVRGPKREIISRCYNLILKSTLAAGFSDAQCGFKAIRADVAAAPAAARRRHRLVLRHRAAGAGRTHAGCASTRCRWTGSTTPTAGSTSSPPRSPTSRASHGCCAASRRAPSRCNTIAAQLGSSRTPAAAGIAAAPVGAVRERRRRVHGRLPAAVHAAARLARRTGGEPDRAAASPRSATPRPTAASPSAWPGARTGGAPPRRRADRLRHRACHHQRCAGAAARRRPRTGTIVDATVLVAANLLATVVRFVLLRGWVFHPRRNRMTDPTDEGIAIDDDHR